MYEESMPIASSFQRSTELHRGIAKNPDQRRFQQIDTVSHDHLRHAVARLAKALRLRRNAATQEAARSPASVFSNARRYTP